MRQRREKIIVLTPDGVSPLLPRIISDFDVECVRKVAEWIEKASSNDVGMLLIDPSSKGEVYILDALSNSNSNIVTNEKPRVVFLSKPLKVDRLKVFELGCDDVIDSTVLDVDLLARLHKSRINHIANSQLLSRLNEANQMAHSAVTDSSYLANSVQFLLSISSCSNFDELGQLFFSASVTYGLRSSLQIRGKFATKNMEANGLAKNLESQLMHELSDRGRFVDFGNRCAINHGPVSLIIKNMPNDEQERVAIKQNVFTLVEGVAARVEAIDALMAVDMEKRIIGRLTQAIRRIITVTDENYKKITFDCIEAVETISLQLEQSISTLDLTEDQELAIGEIIKEGVNIINDLFSKGSKMDEDLRSLIAQVESVSSANRGIDDVRLMDQIFKKP